MKKEQNDNAQTDNTRGKILIETAAVIDGERNIDYGEPYDDFTTTAEFWQTYIERTITRRGGLALEAHDVAAMMMLLKTARLTWTADKKDHWMDAIGYAACGWECVEKESSEEHELKHEDYISDLYKRAGLDATRIFL